jgi:hypothetical protein
MMAIPNIWRTKKQRYSLEGAVCPTCQTTMFPPRKHCLQCSHTQSVAAHNNGSEQANYFMLFALSQSIEATVAGDD